MRCIRTRSTILRAALFLVLVLLAIPAEAAGTSPLDGLVKEALENNPEIQAAKYGITAMNERPSQAGALPNPSITLGLMNIPTDSFDFKQEAMTQKTIGIMQTFPYPGKRGLKRAVAEKEVVRSKEGLEILKLRIVREVKETYFSLYLVGRSIEVIERNQRLLRDFIRIAETKYSVGKGIQQDVLKAYVELSKMKEKLITLEEKKAVFSARLGYLLNRPTETTFEVPTELEPGHRDVSKENLLARIYESHPVLKGMKAAIEREEKAHLLAKKGYYPDFNVSLQYGQRDDGPMKRADFVSAMVKMQVPLWQGKKEDRKVAERLARVNQAKARYDAAKSRLAFRVRKIKSEMESAFEQTRLFRDGIIPQAKASLESAIAGYQVNKVDFLTLLNNHLTLFNYEIQYYRALATHEIKMAALEEAAGGPLTGHNHEVKP